jgi:hypothetical protein
MDVDSNLLLIVMHTVTGRMLAGLCVLLGVGLALQTTAAASLSVPERDRVSLQAQILKSPLEWEMPRARAGFTRPPRPPIAY